MTQVRTLADTHEFGLAANSSDSVRAIAGATLGAQILQAMNATLALPSKSPRLNIQFGAYASFFSFWALAGLPTVNPDFYGIPDYASTMLFELFTTATPPPSSSSAPINTADVQVRFLFHNGTASNTSEPTAYPLFGNIGAKPEISWTDFVAGMNKFTIGDQKDWCQACGNSTGVCAVASPPVQAGGSKSGGNDNGGGGVSKPVAGVIGAVVTLAVILGAEALIMLIAGVRLVKRRKDSATKGVGNGNGETSSGSEAAVKH